MKGPQLISFSEDRNFFGFNIEAGEIKGVYLSNPESELVHQGIHCPVTDPQDCLSIDSGKEKLDLFRRQGIGPFSVPLSDFQNVIKGQIVCTGQVVQFQEIPIASECEDFPVDGSAAVFAPLFKVVLEVDYSRSVDGDQIS